MTDPVVWLWLTAKLDEVEEIAKAAERDAGSPWRTEGNYRDDRDIVVASTPLPGYTRPTYWLWNSEEDVHGSPAVAAHVAGMDPAMVLLLVAATRVVLELHKPNQDNDCTTCGWSDGYEIGGHEEWPCPTLRAVAVGWGWADD